MYLVAMKAILPLPVLLSFLAYKGKRNIFTHASYLKQEPYAYLLKADVSLILRRCPRGAASVGELGGVTVVMHWETDSSL
jgi:hypothetical protein